MEKEKVEYVSDMIGDDYKKWWHDKTIFIKTPTGSGKSFFILDKLLEYVVSNSGKILYLVNRKILKSQLEKEIDNIANKYDYTTKLENYINIFTYQTIEKLLLENSLEKNYGNYFNGFSHVIYDECHYFLIDAAFNTSTELSYDFLRNTFCRRVQIFLSATMDNIRPILEKRKEFVIENNSPYRFSQPELYDEIKPDYSYLDVKLLEEKDDLLKRILENFDDKKEKWLIFVDSISYGKQLYDEIVNYYKKLNNIKDDYEDIIFLDASFKNNNETKEVVDNIVKEKRSKKILITTSVMDNGISLEDEYLRNIVIMADIQETFIQMLGRKRMKNSNETSKLYILKRNITYFKNKIKNVESILSFYNNNQYNYESLEWNNFFNYISQIPNENVINPLYSEQKNIINSKENTSKNNLFIVLLFMPYEFYKLGFKKNPNIQQTLLSNLIKNDIKNEDIHKKLLYSYFGILEFNSFSIEYYRYLFRNYNEIINNLEKDEYYFVKKQLSWINLDKDNEEIDKLIDDIDKKHKIHLLQSLNRVRDMHLSSQENQNLKKEIRSDLEYFLKKCKLEIDDNLINNIKRTDSSLSEDSFNKAMNAIDKFIGCKYIMCKTPENKFTIKLTN